METFSSLRVELRRGTHQPPLGTTRSKVSQTHGIRSGPGG